MSVMEETMVLEAAAPAAPEVQVAPADPRADAQAYLRNEQEVWHHNLEAMRVDTESLHAFLELVAMADAEYLDAEEYVQEPMPRNTVDWDAVDNALAESQQILIGVQQLLSHTLAEMGVEDHEYLRVFSDAAGMMRLVGDHERKEEIETVLNSPAHAELRNLYQAATSGMSMAGGLVGKMSVPEEVLEKIQAKAGVA